MMDDKLTDVSAFGCDPADIAPLIKRRQEMGGDRYDEVWDGLYVLGPDAVPERQRIISGLCHALWQVLVDDGLGIVYAGANVADRTEDWEKNFRCPAIVVVMKGSQHRCREVGAALVGGPDLLAEVHSPGDRTFEKLDFYASIGVRELLVVDRDTKAIRFFRLQAGKLVEVDASDGWFASDVVGLSFRTGAKTTVEVKTNQPPYRSWRV